MVVNYGLTCGYFLMLMVVNYGCAVIDYVSFATESPTVFLHCVSTEVKPTMFKYT